MIELFRMDVHDLGVLSINYRVIILLSITGNHAYCCFEKVFPIPFHTFLVLVHYKGAQRLAYLANFWFCYMLQDSLTCSICSICCKTRELVRKIVKKSYVICCKTRQLLFSSSRVSQHIYKAANLANS